MRVLESHERPLMTTAEAARLLGVSPRRVARLAARGEVRAIRFGENGHWRVLRASVDALVRAEPTVDEMGSRRSTPTRQRNEEGE